MTIAFFALRFLDRSLIKFWIELNKFLTENEKRYMILSHQDGTEIHMAHKRIYLREFRTRINFCPQELISHQWSFSPMNCYLQELSNEAIK